MTAGIDIEDLAENPEKHGFKPVYCDLCGETNYYSDDHMGGCMCQMPTLSEILEEQKQ